ncbi:MAG TPA: CHAT domain-containing tetratricopeptide repeat protein, partial [Pyrinomonadaceae bacterium]|nr:CHAT domain-containing tetratricopeptide repeat protein [Pyrinomonadaceae bacterium]
LYAAIENPHFAAVTSGYIGRVRLALGDNERALQSFNRKLLMSRVVQDRRMESYTLRDIGNVLAEKGKQKEALAQYRDALSLSQDVKDRRGAALILVAIGKLAEKSGDNAGALANYEQALSMMQAVADRRGEAQTLMNLASAKRDSGRLDDARHDIERSLGLIEKVRTKVLSPALRISYLETVYRHYEFYVDLMMRMHERNPSGGYDTLALEANEHARARTLLENLMVVRTDIRQGVDPQLLQEERQIQQRLNEKAEQQTRLLSTRTQPEREAAIRLEVESLLSQYKEIESRVRDQSPKYAALTQPRPLNLAGIQQELDEDTLLVEYALGTERSYGWAVTKHSSESFKLPPRAEITRSAKVLYDALSQQGAATLVDDYRTAANELSKILLEPVAHRLPGKRLVIVADGILQYIPFTALPEPGVKEDGLRVPLVVNHEIVTLPSISTLAVLRNELRGRIAASKTLAVIADPVFESDDPRVRQSRLQVRTQLPGNVAPLRGSDTEEPLGTVGRDIKPIVFERLPFSLEEADAILNIARTRKVMRAVGFDANLKAALDPAIREYEIIHFATHALLHNSPELSGIVLSLVDQSGRMQDGFLRLNEIYNLDLAADLVVLSACQTALGKETRGEGLIGLTRGFMYAGVPRVVASLWRINDRSTAEFMRYFYEAMLNQQETPSKALRSAQIKMWETNKSAIPHSWSAFTLQGEWR